MSLRSRVAFVFLFSGSLYLSNAVSCLAKVNRHDTVIMKRFIDTVDKTEF